jgi:hypothetical protein
LTLLNDGAVWPFDAGQSDFIILNLAIGGDYPGPPNSSTPFPSEMLVDYVRVYTNWVHRHSICSPFIRRSAIYLIARCSTVDIE